MPTERAANGDRTISMSVLNLKGEKNMKASISILLLGILMGCASKQYYIPGYGTSKVDSPRWAKDSYECSRDRAVFASSAPAHGGILDRAVRDAVLDTQFDRCLASRGWIEY